MSFYARREASLAPSERSAATTRENTPAFPSFAPDPLRPWTPAPDSPPDNPASSAQLLPSVAESEEVNEILYPPEAEIIVITPRPSSRRSTAALEDTTTDIPPPTDIVLPPPRLPPLPRNRFQYTPPSTPASYSPASVYNFFDNDTLQSDTRLPPPTKLLRKSKSLRLTTDQLAPHSSLTHRLGRSLYHALEIHGNYGLIDTGIMDDQGYRVLTVHVPKTSRGYFLDLCPGEIIHVNSVMFPNVTGRLQIGYVTPYKYIRPGNAITHCTIGVPPSQWTKFVDLSI